MSFTHPRGTRGARAPRGRLMSLMNKAIARWASRSTKSVMGVNLLVLTTIGAKSGQQRHTPLAWFPGPSGSRYVLASANGAARNPGWYYNLAANPDRVSIDVGGKTIPVTAEEVHEQERTNVWEGVLATSRFHAQADRRTDRPIPVIRLTPRD